MYHYTSNLNISNMVIHGLPLDHIPLSHYAWSILPAWHLLQPEKHDQMPGVNVAGTSSMMFYVHQNRQK